MVQAPGNFLREVPVLTYRYIARTVPRLPGRKKKCKYFQPDKVAGRSGFFRRALLFLEESSAGALEMQATTVMYSIMYKNRAENRQKYQAKPLNSENFTWLDMKKIENIEDIRGYAPLISCGACSRCSSPVSGGCTCSQRRCPR